MAKKGLKTAYVRDFSEPSQGLLGSMDLLSYGPHLQNSYPTFLTCQDWNTVTPQSASWLPGDHTTAEATPGITLVPREPDLWVPQDQ